MDFFQCKMCFHKIGNKEINKIILDNNKIDYNDYYSYSNDDWKIIKAKTTRTEMVTTPIIFLLLSVLLIPLSFLLFSELFAFILMSPINMYEVNVGIKIYNANQGTHTLLIDCKNPSFAERACVRKLRNLLHKLSRVFHYSRDTE